jgi:D-glycero-D-manno-heptose 1,7-bisphosphate phosphatase
MTSVSVRPPYLDPELPRLLERLPAPRRALFLDRDGVINVDHGYVHTPQQTDWMPGIFDLVAAAHANGYLPVVVTNQAGIARGYYTEDDFLAYTAWVHDQFRAHVAPLAATFYCPHHPEHGNAGYRASCSCRKPGAAMILSAAEALNIMLEESILIGDKPSDIAAGRASGINGGLFLLKRAFSQELD